MKAFYIKVCIFIMVFCMFCAGVEYMSIKEPGRSFIARVTDSEDYIRGNVGSDEIKPYIEQVRTEDNTTKLIIGDSVCRQMFRGLQEYNSDICIVGSNGAITMAGQYILAEQYLEHHPATTDIFLVVLPESLHRTFDTIYGYQYTVMPFVETDTLKLLDENTVEAMQSIYGSFFMQPKVVDLIDRSAINRKIYLNELRDRSKGYIAGLELADRYIYKICELCEERGVQFHLYACPVSESKRKSVENEMNQYEQSGLYQFFPDFLKDVYYFPDEQFGDGTHFSGDYNTQESLNEKINEMFADTRLLQVLKME